MLRARYRRILLFFTRVILGLLIWELALPRLGLAGWARRSRSERLRRIAADFRVLAVEMGGVLIKVGQFLSARVDVLPEEITVELAGLQDEVPPENFAAIRRLAETEFGAPLSARFASFDETPLAAASLGQVHRARLPHPPPPAPPLARPGRGERGAEGAEAAWPEHSRRREVVVKIQRPDIERLIATDLAALRTVGSWIMRYPPIRKRADVPALLAEFSRILYEEIDYLAEGRNAETFAANFAGQSGVRVPRVVWTHTTRRVLTLEDVYAIKITDYDNITAAGVDRAEVAERLFHTYLKQIFEDGFFHADPHPGNLFVQPLADHAPMPPAPFPEREEAAGVRSGDGVMWELTFVDFGMVGRVPSNLRAGLREMAIAVGTKDASRLVKSYQMLGVLLPHADLALLEKMEARLFERFWGKSMTELRRIGLQEMGEFTREFRGLIYQMPFQVPQDLVLLGRTVAILSGMCTGLNPEFNVWDGLAPYAQRLLADEAVSGWEYWLDEVGALARSLLGLPKRTEAVLGKLERGEVVVQLPQVVRQIARLELAVRRMVGGVIFAALLVGGVTLYLAGQSVFASLLLAGAAVALLWVVLGRPDSGA